MGLFSLFKKKEFFSTEEKDAVMQAIGRCEHATSGEMRVFVESRNPMVDPLDRAGEIFFRLNMQSTDNRNAVLLYIAMKDNELALFGDEGIFKATGAEYWNDAVKNILSHFSKENIVGGIVHCIEEVGEALKEKFPYDAGTDKNELPDEIVFGALAFATYLIKMKKLLLIFLSLLTGLAVFSQAGFNAEDLLKPGAAPHTLVNDYSNTLTTAQVQALEAKLVAFDDSSSTQIAVVIVPDLNGNDAADFNVKLGRAWGVGGKEFNNGVVLLISKDDRKLNIATGYGAEGALPDITAKQIIDNDIVPEFKGNDYYRGIDEGTNAIIEALRGEYHTQRTTYTNNGAAHGLGKAIFYIIIIIVVLIISARNRGGGGGGGIANALFWSSMLGAEAAVAGPAAAVAEAPAASAVSAAEALAAGERAGAGRAKALN